MLDMLALLGYGCLMTNTTLSPVMDRQRQWAEHLDFSFDSFTGLYRHSSKMLALSILDADGCWEVILMAHRPSWNGSSTYLIETGRVRLSCASEVQFSAVLVALINTVS
jgi:hypothetical protein